MDKKKKRPFTLLELFLTIAVIGLAVGLIGMHLPKALRSEGFEQEVQRFQKKIALAQEIACDWDNELVLEFQYAPGTLTCIFHAENLPPQMKKGVNRRTKFKTIRHVLFDGNEISHLLFHVRSGMPKGVMTIQGVDNHVVEITLGGFPGKIEQGRSPYQDEVDYPQEILSFT